MYICHEEGTQIFDPDLQQWMAVEDHPSAIKKLGDGYEVTLAGFPFAPEVVTPEHRYWARRIARRDLGRGKTAEVMFGRPQWIEAQDLDWNTWIAYPIDMQEETSFPTIPLWNRHTQRMEPWECPWFSDPEWWWLFGLWWGDGTLGATGNAQISFSCATAHPHIRQRLIDCLNDAKLPWHEWSPPSGAACTNIYFCHAALARWLQTWRRGKNRKEPPAWVETMPLAYQTALMRGYCDADGYLDDRWMTLTSIHLPGLLATRRMLMRLGIPCQLARRKRDQDFSYQGRTYKIQPSYTLRFAEGAEALGYELDRQNDWVVRDLFCRDGCLWSRVKALDVVHDRTFVPIQTKSQTYYTNFGLSHNCATQSQADDHLQNIAMMMEHLGIQRSINRYGSSRGWRINRLRTSEGYTMDAVGLDSAMRGARIEEARPDFFILDDLDDPLDSALMTQKKIDILTRSILPAGASTMAVLGLQNIPNAHGIFARLADGRADFLLDRTVSGPFPALDDLPEDNWYALDETPNGPTRVRLTAGTPTWAGQSIDDCEALIAKIGIRGFLIECQHHGSKLYEGTMFKRSWFKIVQDWPRDGRAVRYWDFAATKEKPGTDPDYTAGSKLIEKGGQFWLTDMQHDRLSPKEIEDLVSQTAMLDGRSVDIWIEQEPGSAGIHLISHYQRNVLPGFTVRGRRETGPKTERAKPASAAAQAGNFFLVEGPWNEAFLAEAASFPGGPHDDQIDSISGGHRTLAVPKLEVW